MQACILFLEVPPPGGDHGAVFGLIEHNAELVQPLDGVRSFHNKAAQQFRAGSEVAAAELLGGGEVSLPGLGKIKMRETAAREGRNPRTGESLHIPAGKKVVFVPGKDLKEALKP